MPIAPEFRHFYSGAAWREKREHILQRADNKCEQCHKPNGRCVWVYSSPFTAQQYWTLSKLRQNWRSCPSGIEVGIKFVRPSQWRQARRIRVQIHVAHLNHTPGDDRDENLRALCQWCHFHHDRGQHKQTRSARKDRGRPLLVLITEGCHDQYRKGAAGAPGDTGEVSRATAHC